ncbi:Beta-galactosidase [Sphaerulina musiva]
MYTLSLALYTTLLSTVALANQQVLRRSNGDADASSRDTRSASRDRLWPSGMHLAVDYYPSQWPEWMWEPDVARMRDSGFSFVRVNEFDWSVLEPREGEYNFTVLDRTLDLFAKYGLKAIVGTPTAAPPNWLSEKYDISFVDRTNTTLLFGSRRHYSFSSFDYREQSQKITRKLAQRYGNHSSVVGWQLDNEFGCHDTVRSYDHNAKKRFRSWLQDKYGTIENMNKRQGRVFWSSQYASFDTVEPPFLEIYTNNQAHTLDWYTFSSDMVIGFAKEQVEILRMYAPTHAITTNFMVFFTDFDHHKFNREVRMDLATFDEYPLAGTTAIPLSDQEMQDYMRTGVPDLQALQHALYRGISGEAFGTNHGPFGVMEMQPGVLNWNPYRVSPLEGMVRLWTHETFAASGDMVGYFRWRQVPYAQEQTLSGLFLSDNSEDQGYIESQTFAHNDLPKLRSSLQSTTTTTTRQADVALIFDYTAHWIWNIEPYSGSWSVKEASYTNPTLTYTTLVHTFYSSLRRLGLSIDIISPEQDVSGYKILVIPSLPIIPESLSNALAKLSSSSSSDDDESPPPTVILGPHTGSRTADFAYVPGLGIDKLESFLPGLRVTRIETPPPPTTMTSKGAGSSVRYKNVEYAIGGWEEWIVCDDNSSSSDDEGEEMGEMIIGGGDDEDGENGGKGNGTITIPAAGVLVWKIV